MSTVFKRVNVSRLVIAMMMQAVTLLLGAMAVLYHFCMRNDAQLLQKVKEPVRRKYQSVKTWITTKLEVCHS